MDYTYILQLKKEINYSLKTKSITAIISNIDMWIKNYEQAKKAQDTKLMTSIASDLSSYRLTLSFNRRSFIHEDKISYSENIELNSKDRVLAYTNAGDIIKYNGVEYKLKYKTIDIDEQKVYLIIDTEDLLKKQYVKLLKELENKFEPYQSLIETILNER